MKVLPSTESSGGVIVNLSNGSNSVSFQNRHQQQFPAALPPSRPSHPFAFNSFPWSGRPANFPPPNPWPKPKNPKTTIATTEVVPGAPRLPTARPLPPLKPTSFDGTSKDNDVFSRGSSDRNEIPSSSSDRSGRGFDYILIFALALFAAVMTSVLVLISLRYLNYPKRVNLVKSVSRKIPLEVETSLSSVSSHNSLDSRPEFLKSNAHFKWPHANRYESNNGFIASPFNVSKDGWEFPRKNLRFSTHLLGEGNFGQVWKCEALDVCGMGRYGDSEIVAVKMLKQNHSERERRDLLLELQIMKLLEPHPNIVTLLGCCSEQDPVYLIMEYVPNGKLLTYLRESRSEAFEREFGPLSSQDLISFAAQVARGMEYIASKGILHRDLAARNVLVGKDKTCKISDFGFARDVVANRVYEKKSDGRLPIRWMAPESIIDNIYTSKSDVWSFGVLLWEIVTLGMTPYPGIEVKEIPKMLKEGKRLEKPDHCKRELYMLMCYCWESSPKDRVDFHEIKMKLEYLLQSDDDYIELERCPDHNYYNLKCSSPDEKL